MSATIVELEISPTTNWSSVLTWPLQLGLPSRASLARHFCCSGWSLLGKSVQQQHGTNSKQQQQQPVYTETTARATRRFCEL
jgi:hypothetical protein